MNNIIFNNIFSKKLANLNRNNTLYVKLYLNLKNIFSIHLQSTVIILKIKQDCHFLFLVFYRFLKFFPGFQNFLLLNVHIFGSNFSFKLSLSSFEK